VEPGFDVHGMLGTKEQDCPACNGRITFQRRATPWCAACDWNVGAPSLAMPVRRGFGTRPWATPEGVATAQSARACLCWRTRTSREMEPSPDRPYLKPRKI
jgi:hypothetical protein